MGDSELMDMADAANSAEEEKSHEKNMKQAFKLLQFYKELDPIDRKWLRSRLEQVDRNTPAETDPAYMATKSPADQINGG